MKSKKLFAILTLVAFMMTLVPMAALAAPDRFATVASSNKTSVTANGTDTITFTVYTYNNANQIVSNEVVYFASSRSTTDSFVIDAAYAGPVAQSAKSNAQGKIEFKVKSNVPGAAKIAIGNGGTGGAGTEVSNISAYLAGGSTAPSADAAGIIKVFDVTFTAPSADSFGYSATASGGAIAGTGVDAANAYNEPNTNGNGVDYFEISFQLKAANGAPVSDAEVSISGNKTDLTFNKTSITTDAAGIAKVKVYAAKPGTYAVKAESGDVNKTVYVKFATNDPYDVELISDANQTVAKDADFTLKFKLMDANGNKITVPTTYTTKTAQNVDTDYSLKFEATTRPTDAAMDEKIYTNSATGDYEFKGNDDGYLEMKIKGKELDKEGDYNIKAYFDSGKYVNVPFTVKKQGTVTRISIAYDQTAVPLNTAVAAPTVKWYDAEGVSKSVSSGLVFSASDVTKVTTFNSTTGAFTTTSDDKYAGDFVITVVDTNKNLSASTTMTLAKQASGIVLTAPIGNTVVGQDAEVQLQVVDVAGNPVAMSDIAAASVDFYTVAKPAGAIVSSSSATGILTNIKEKGLTPLKISSNVAGDVTVQVVLTVTKGGVDTIFTKDVTVSFGDVQQVIGAKNVTMFIGAPGYTQDGTPKVTDVAPFIQDGRTFVAVRPIADAFGAEIGWDEATQTVTLTRSDMTLTIVIGSNTITKVAGGVTSAITADVAAFIKDGRTVLPFRAVGEAFGATVSYDATTQAVTYAQ